MALRYGHMESERQAERLQDSLSINPDINFSKNLLELSCFE